MGLADWVKQVTKVDTSTCSKSSTNASVYADQVAEVEVTRNNFLPGSTVIRDEPGSTAGANRWIGFIDRVTLSTIEGWAFDTHNPDTSVTIELVTSKGKRVLAIAQLYREDVKEAGFGAGTYGFVFDLTKLQLADESAIVRFASSKHPITREPIDFDPSRAVLTTDMPHSFFGVMGQLGEETWQAAEALGTEK